jgi:hypothetical protein
MVPLLATAAVFIVAFSHVPDESNVILSSPTPPSLPPCSFPPCSFPMPTGFRLSVGAMALAMCLFLPISLPYTPIRRAHVPRRTLQAFIPRHHQTPLLHRCPQPRWLAPLPKPTLLSLTSSITTHSLQVRWRPSSWSCRRGGRRGRAVCIRVARPPNGGVQRPRDSSSSRNLLCPTQSASSCQTLQAEQLTRGKPPLSFFAHLLPPQHPPTPTTLLPLRVPCLCGASACTVPLSPSSVFAAACGWRALLQSLFSKTAQIA